MKKALTVAGVIWVLLCQTSVFAGTPRPVPTLDEVVVSVTQTQTHLEDIGGNSVTVITAEDIEDKGYHTVPEILGTVPGVSMISNGGMGTKSSVIIRGADSKNTLVLIDGVMVNDPSGANRDANLADINLDNVERIEVVRGAMSVMYGSNATAGVINIITRSGSEKPEGYVTAEGGSYGTWKAGAGMSGTVARAGYSLSASTLTRDGFSVADADNDRIPQNGNTDEKDGYKNLTLSGRVKVDVSDDFHVAASLRYVDSEVELDDYAGGYTGDNISSEWVQDPVSGEGVNTLVPNPAGPKHKRSEAERTWGLISATNTFKDKMFESVLTGKFSRSDRQSFDNDNDSWYDYNGATNEVSWQGNILFDNSTLSFGAALFMESMESMSASVASVDTRTTSLWVQDQLFVTDSLTLIAGARLDDHEAFGQKATFRLAPSYKIQGTGTLLKASFGTGFRSPSLYELYSSYGNPDLSPEESIGWDAGIVQRLADDTVKLELTYFQMDFKERIDYDMMISRYNQLPGTTQTRGVEVAADWMPTENVTLGVFYAYTHTRGPDDRRLARRPYNQAGMTATVRFLEKASVSMDAKWVGERLASPYARDMDGNTVETLGSYTLVNLAASYDFSRRLQLFARVDNLFDRYYEEAFSYATAGLSGYLGVRVRW